MKRIFFALTLNDFTKGELERLQEKVRPFTKKGRFVPPALFHLTLQFLGELEEEKVLHLTDLTFHWLKQFNSLELNIHHLGCFQKRNRWILWAGVKKNPVLDQLVSLLHASMDQQGFINHQPFKAHITLAREVQFRSKEDQLACEAMEITVPSLSFNGFHLMESTRVEGRLHYVSRRKFFFFG